LHVGELSVWQSVRRSQVSTSQSLRSPVACCASRHSILDSRCCTDSLILHFCGRVLQVDTLEAKGSTELHCFCGLQIQYRPFQSLLRRHHLRRSLADAQALLRLQLCFILLVDCHQWTGNAEPYSGNYDMHRCKGWSVERPHSLVKWFDTRSCSLSLTDCSFASLCNTSIATDLYARRTNL
jgi:hypothetical protein